jgi:hypothetical protein
MTLFCFATKQECAEIEQLGSREQPPNRFHRHPGADIGLKTRMARGLRYRVTKRAAFTSTETLTIHERKTS